MNKLVLSVVILLLAAPAGAQAETAFQRPDCPAADAVDSAEARCIRDVRKRWQQANFDALQQTGLMFAHMGRPEIDRHPAAKAVIENKVEGSFTVRFSVAPDGSVYNVSTVDVTAGIEPLAKMWAETIGQWTFVKPDKPVADVEYRRIYLYAGDDEAESQKKPQATL
jgi:hypothetical protein